MKMNRLMRVYLRNPRVRELMQRPLPAPLKKLVGEGVVSRYGLWLLRREMPDTPPVYALLNDDATGYECFANHIHVSDFVDPTEYAPRSRMRLRDEVGYGMRYALELQRALPSSQTFVTIVACSNSCTVRFHKLRPAERWAAEDMEGSCREAVLELRNHDDLRLLGSVEV
jgi:hypothetical protein